MQPVADIHIHVQPWSQLKPDVREKFETRPGAEDLIALMDQRGPIRRNVIDATLLARSQVLINMNRTDDLSAGTVASRHLLLRKPLSCLHLAVRNLTFPTLDPQAGWNNPRAQTSRPNHEGGSHDGAD